MKSFLALLLGLAALVTFAPMAYAQELRQEETVVVKKDEIINQDLFAAGESVTISGVVNGDAYVGGGTILVDGTINGDLIVAGGSITIGGVVQNDIRVFGGNVTLMGVVGGNVTVIAGNAQITDSARIGGGIVGGAGNMEILAPVSRGITVGTAHLRLGSTVGGNVTYWSDKEVDLTTGATVSGNLVQYIPPHDPHVEGRKAAGSAFAGVGAMFAALKIIELFGLLLVGVVLIKFAPNLVTSTIESTNAKPGKALFVGFVTAVVAPVGIVLLLLSGVGAALAFVGAALFGILYFAAKIFTALFVGTKALSWISKKINVYGALLIGLVILTFLLFVPVLGWITSTILYLIGLGGLMLEKSRFYSVLRSKDLI